MVRLWLVVAYIHYRWMRLKDHEWGGGATWPISGPYPSILLVGLKKTQKHLS